MAVPGLTAIYTTRLNCDQPLATFAFDSEETMTRVYECVRENLPEEVTSYGHGAGGGEYVIRFCGGYGSTASVLVQQIWDRLTQSNSDVDVPIVPVSKMEI